MDHTWGGEPGTAWSRLNILYFPLFSRADAVILIPYCPLSHAVKDLLHGQRKYDGLFHV